MAIQVIDGGREIKFLSASNNKTIIPIPHIDTGGLRNNYMLEFGADGIPIMPEIILAQRGGHKIGRINNLRNLRFTFNFNSPDEISFQVDHFLDRTVCAYWGEIQDFKLVYVPCLNLWYEIYVSTDDSGALVKQITGIAVSEAELGQIMLYGVEINTEADILRDDYEATTIYNSENPKASALNRLLEKAPHYKIVHVDESLAKLQRTFTFDSTSIYDAFNEIAQEINGIFIYNQVVDEESVPRTIALYDLENYCPQCGHREESMSVCPECGNTDIVKGYGDDTTIFVSVENLADNINFTTNTDAVKNCFHLETGDDLMTATVINCNPNGSGYMWYFSNDVRKSMSSELQEKLSEYDDLYEYYENDYELQISSGTFDAYNNLIEKYKAYDSSLSTVSLPVVGYDAITNLYYDTIDFYGYLENTLMPSPQLSDTSAEEQASYLTSSNLSPTSVQDVSYISLATANNAILSYAKVYVDTSRYQLTILESSIDNVTWTGKFQVESYSDEEDVATTENITIIFDDNFETFVRQKIDKMLAKNENSDMGIVALFQMENADFENELKKHCLSNLEMFYNACQACIDILIENDIATPDKWIDPDNNLYTKLYVPYTEKLNYIAAEIQVRENELAIIKAPDITEGTVTKPAPGIQDLISEERSKIMSDLDFEKYVGTDLWHELLCYRREDSYSNTNYISDGLSNSELIQNAQQFIEAARRELIKAATAQHSISSTLKDLLIMPEFAPIVDKFRLGNWMRIQIDDNTYKLRLISYSIDFSSLDTLNITFSDVAEIMGVVSDTKSVLDQARSMATSYGAVMHQAVKGSDANQAIADIATNGLALTTTKIVNDAFSQDVIYGNNGLLCRKYNDITGTYDLEQIKIINKGLYFTNDGWETAKAGIGEYIYYNPETEQTETGYGLIAETIVGNIMLSESVGIYNESQSVRINSDGFVITAKEGTESLESLFTIQKEDSNGDINKLFYIDSQGNANFNGYINAASGSTFGYWTIENTAIYHTNPIWGSADGKYFGDNGISITDKFRVNSAGDLISSGTLSIANGNLRYDTENGLRITGATITGTQIDFGYWISNDEGLYYGNQAWGSANGQYFGRSGLSIGNLFTVDASGNTVLLADVKIGDDALLYDNDLLVAKGAFYSYGTDNYIALSEGSLIGGEGSTQQATLLLQSDTTIDADNSVSINASTSVSLSSDGGIVLSAPTIQLSGTLSIDNTFSGTFATQDGLTVTVTNGIITSIL